MAFLTKYSDICPQPTKHYCLDSLCVHLVHVLMLLFSHNCPLVGQCLAFTMNAAWAEERLMLCTKLLLESSINPSLDHIKAHDGASVAINYDPGRSLHSRDIQTILSTSDFNLDRK